MLIYAAIDTTAVRAACSHPKTAAVAIVILTILVSKLLAMNPSY